MEITKPDRAAMSLEEVLVDNAIRRITKRKGRNRCPLWSVVSAQFMTGSSSAKYICVKFGYDPDTFVAKYG